MIDVLLWPGVVHLCLRQYSGAIQNLMPNICNIHLIGLSCFPLSQSLAEALKRWQKILCNRRRNVLRCRTELFDVYVVRQRPRWILIMDGDSVLLERDRCFLRVNSQNITAFIYLSMYFQDSKRYAQGNGLDG